MHESRRCWQPMSASAWAVSTRPLAERQLLIRHQTPGGGALGGQLADARALLRVEVNAHVVLIAGHGIQRFVGEGQQLGGMQGQLAADHLLGDLLHQLQQFLAPRLLVLALEVLERLDQPLQRPRSSLEGLAPLLAPLFAAEGAAILDAALEALAVTGLAALLEALAVALVDAFLKTVGDRPLQRRRIAGQAFGELRRGLDPRREPERPPAAACALDHLDRHLIPPSVRGTAALAARHRRTSRGPPP